VRRRPRVAVLYHYLYPDDVVSARHLGDFCVDLAARGWDVEALPCNRSCHHAELTFPGQEQWQSVAINRVWRPPFRQASARGRILNTAWMLAAWSALSLRRRNAPDVVVIGTDPVLSVLVAPVLKRLRPSVRIAHWAFDLYPECAVAEGLMGKNSLLVRLLRPRLRRAYAACDLIADLGPCMRSRLDHYQPNARRATLVPWSLVQPDTVEASDPAVRRALFGDAKLGLLYSGNLGRAHTYHQFIELARRLRSPSPSPLPQRGGRGKGEGGIRFAFGVRGPRARELQSDLRPEDTNVALAPFVPEEMLAQRLAAADIHLASLRPDWTGLVLPSKFFGSLATGRPVLFAGSRDCAIARWIAEHRVGWVLDDSTLDAVAAELRALQHEPGRLAETQRHCQRVYHAHFSRQRVMDAWHEELTRLLPCSNARQTTEPQRHRESTDHADHSLASLVPSL
jgi:glycosyltransferase involved in cell wall biosynthesis